MDKTRAQILGENLERIRKEKGYSRKQLAEYLGVNVDAIGKYETGQREPPLDKIFKLATFLEFSVASLIGENGYNAEIPNIAAIVDKKIFEYRYKRAVKLTNVDNIFYPTTELENGNIAIVIPSKVTRAEDGALTFYDKATAITFRDKKIFVDTIERAEQTAAENYIPFYQALKMLVDNVKKT